MIARSSSGGSSVPHRVAFVDLVAQHAEVTEEVEPRVLDIMRPGDFVGGPPVASVEDAFASFCAAQQCIGKDALELAMRAIGVTAVDEAIMPANTLIATAEAASRVGADLVPADVNEHLLIDPTLIEATITERMQLPHSVVCDRRVRASWPEARHCADRRERGRSDPVPADASEPNGRGPDKRRPGAGPEAVARTS